MDVDHWLSFVSRCIAIFVAMARAILLCVDVVIAIVVMLLRLWLVGVDVVDCVVIVVVGC